jgi:hypothetical protein
LQTSQWRSTPAAVKIAEHVFFEVQEEDYERQCEWDTFLHIRMPVSLPSQHSLCEEQGAYLWILFDDDDRAIGFFVAKAAPSWKQVRLTVDDFPTA